MARLRPWAARWPVGKRATRVEYPVAAGEDIPLGALVQLNGSNEAVKLTGADPTPIKGVATEASASSLITGKVLVHVMDNTGIFAFQGDDDPTLADRGQEYGLTQDGDGIWYVDGTKTVATRVSVEDVDLVRKLYFVKLLAAHRQ